MSHLLGPLQLPFLSALLMAILIGSLCSEGGGGDGQMEREFEIYDTCISDKKFSVERDLYFGCN